MEIKQTEPAQILACLKEIFASQQLSAIQLAEAATQSISLGAYLAGELVGGIVIKRKLSNGSRKSIKLLSLPIKG